MLTQNIAEMTKIVIIEADSRRLEFNMYFSGEDCLAVSKKYGVPEPLLIILYYVFNTFPSFLGV